MLVGELKYLLSKFDDSMEFKIADGYEYMFWSGDFVVQQFEDFVELGIGGCLEE